MSHDRRMFGSRLWGRLAKSRARKHTRIQSRRPAVESLEDRRLLASGRALASISGTVFNDEDGDSTKESGESGQCGWQVFADADSDGQLDRGQVSAISGR